MGVDLSQFYQVFYEESAEHLAEMESIFLSIDPDNPDEEELNAVFRAAHSIKGGAGTFGFPDMAQVTHILETLLDRVRHAELALNREMVDVFLEAGDAIAIQLAGHRDGAHVDQIRIEAVCDKLRTIAEADKPAVAASQTSPAAPLEQLDPDACAETSYCIIFTPPPDFFNRMVPMEPIFAELACMGELTHVAKIAVPDSFDEYDLERCITVWEIRLTTSCSLDEIRDVFMFVADEDEISFEIEVPAASAAELIPAVVEAAGPNTADADSVKSGQRLHNRDERTSGAFGRRNTDSPEASSIRVGVSKVDQLINQMGELIITQAMLLQTAQKFDPAVHEDLHLGMELLQRNTHDLQESVMSIRMMPINFIFSRFTRLVHDLAGKLGKKVELKLVGETTELDKGLIEKLADPLTHLVRNSLDHGIELPEDRMLVGKSPNGTITLRAAQTGGRIVIEVADDGAGLNRAKILRKAAEKEMPVSDEMTDEEVWQLIFAPGFSTAEEVTDVSGRGVGMDVVMKNIHGMGGRVSVFSEAGVGSRVIVSLPLTMAILDGLSVRVGSEIFIIPLNSIIESLQPLSKDLNEVGGKTTVRVRDAYLPLLRLNEVYNIQRAVERPEEAVVIIVDAEGEQVALLVDELLNQPQVVIKSLETNYRKVDGTAGATILGDGRVALILDVSDLLRLWRSR